jgi:mono/diheme cytochrome c family protein
MTLPKNRVLIPAVLLLASLAAVAAAANNSQDQNAAGQTAGQTNTGILAPIAEAPAKARNRANPFEGRPDVIAAGEKLYKQHCAECHGEDATGEHGRAANLRAPYVQNATPGQLAWVLRNGNIWHGMPSWAGIPEQRRWQIVSYLKSLGTTHAGARKSAEQQDGQ